MYELIYAIQPTLASSSSLASAEVHAFYRVQCSLSSKTCVIPVWRKGPQGHVQYVCDFNNHQPMSRSLALRSIPISISVHSDFGALQIIYLLTYLQSTGTYHAEMSERQKRDIRHLHRRRNRCCTWFPWRPHKPCPSNLQDTCTPSRRETVDKCRVCHSH